MKQIKEAYQQAQNELENKKKFKEVIKETLEKLEQKQQSQREIVREIQILKADVKNFKDGRLDLIEERQSKDPRTKEISVVQIKKEKIVEKTPYWQQPYAYNTADTEKGIWTTGFCANNTFGTYILRNGKIKNIN